jgi:hypothetical membrane protein
MKNFFRIFGVIVLVIGAVLVNFTSIPLVQYLGIFGEALGLTLTVIGVWKKADKKTWKEAVAIICFILAAVGLGIAGVSKDVAVELATAIAGIVAMIIALFVSFVDKAKEEKK